MEKGFRIDPLFVGRKKELTILQRELIDSLGRIVWISGAAGVGKTALAMMFATLQQEAFPGGAYNLHAVPFETLGKSVARSLPSESSLSLLIINEGEVRPQSEIAQELAAILRTYPQTRVIVTARAAPPKEDNFFQLHLRSLPLEEYHELIERRLRYSGITVLADDPSASHRPPDPAVFADELFAQLGGNPLTAMLITELLQGRQLTPRELLERLHSFAWPGIVGPHGEILPEETPEHRHLVSDIVTVSDEFLHKIHQNPNLLYELTPRGFEELVAELLGRLGYEITLTPPSKDGGKDICAARKDHLGTFLYIVECKRYAPDNPVGVGLVRQLNGVVQAEQATAGILATTSYFTKGAQEFQKMIPYQISLKDYIGIQDWLESVLNRDASNQRRMDC